MSEVEFRKVQGEELLETSLRLEAIAYPATPPSRQDQQDQRRQLALADQNVNLVGFVDGVPRVSGAIVPFSQNVRGAIVSMGGPAGVAVHPNVRRRGLGRALVERMLRTMRDAGQSVSALYPFRESFYQRLGWALGPKPRVVTFSPLDLAPLLRAPLDGDAELVEWADGQEERVAFLATLQRSAHGMAVRPPGHLLRPGAWLTFARSGGETVGLMGWRLDRWQGSITASTFLARSAEGRLLLWRSLALLADQAKEATIVLGPGELPETWLADVELQVRSRWEQFGSRDAMFRVVSVDGLDGIGAGPGQFRARIVDPLAPWNEGGWRFTGSDGRLRIEHDAEADEPLTIEGLSGLVWCGQDPALFRARGWGSPSDGMQDAMRRMFPPALPYLYETF